MINLAYFIAGYGVIFGLIGAYILRLVVISKRLKREREELSSHN